MHTHTHVAVDLVPIRKLFLGCGRIEVTLSEGDQPASNSYGMAFFRSGALSFQLTLILRRTLHSDELSSTRMGREICSEMD